MVHVVALLTRVDALALLLKRWLMRLVAVGISSGTLQIARALHKLLIIVLFK